MQDARFEDGAEKPLNIGALDLDDLKVLSSLVQDAVLPVGEIQWRPKSRQLGLLVNRFRWEDKEAAEAQGRPLERVQSVITVNSVLKVSSQGINRTDKETIVSILSVEFEGNSPDDAGFVTFVLAGDGALRAEVEALDIAVRDVTRPYRAPSGKAPSHPND